MVRIRYGGLDQGGGNNDEDKWTVLKIYIFWRENQWIW